MAHRLWASASLLSSLGLLSWRRVPLGSSEQRWPATTRVNSVAFAKRYSGSGTARALMPQR
eukprot:6850442-Alexandrium_andersonii.AAC.1